jgi:hypothetical protein
MAEDQGSQPPAVRRCLGIDVTRVPSSPMSAHGSRKAGEDFVVDAVDFARQLAAETKRGCRAGLKFPSPSWESFMTVVNS